MRATSSIHEFGSFRLDSAERLLLKAGQPVSLTPKAFDLLVYLVERDGRLVTKQELMTSLWPDTFVEEANLTYTVSALRKALGQGGEQFIQTVPTRGYRFVAPVSRVENLPASSMSETAPRWIPAFLPRVGIVALAVAVFGMLPVLVRHLRETTEATVPAMFTIPLPDTAFGTTSKSMPQVSPDGRRVAVVVAASGGGIWIHNIDSNAARAIPGTEDAMGLFWAPDSQQLAFTTSSALKKLSVSRGTLETLSESEKPSGGGTWSPTGTIVFPTTDGVLLGIPAAGGAAEAVTSLDRSRGEIAHLSPHFLPDGRRFLYVIRNAEASRSGLHVGQLGSANRRFLLQGDFAAVYAAPGYLLFVRAGNIVARPFDPNRLEFIGEARPLVAASDTVRDEISGQAAFSASETGVLAYSIVERPLSQFHRVSRAGEPLQTVGEPAAHHTFDLSEDGRRLAFARVGGGHASLWVHDLERRVTSRLTHGASLHFDPRWAGDSQRLIATRWLPRPQAIVQISPDGAEKVISSSAVAKMVEDVSRDEQYLLYRERGQSLLAMPLSDGSEPVPVRNVLSGSINQAQFSPDNRWIAYRADETGRFEAYVTAYPPGGERWPVSSDGGVQPLWRQDGRGLYYLGLDGTLHSVELRVDNDQPRFSKPTRLFHTGLLAPSATVEQYAASGDGAWFLILKPLNDRVRSSIGMVLDWPALLAPAQSP